MADAPTTGELVEAKVITADDLDLLVTTYLAAPSAALLPLGPEHSCGLVCRPKRASMSTSL